MSIDLLNDLLIVYGLKIHLTTIIGWLSGLIGLYANYRQIKKLNLREASKQKDRDLKELAERCYYKVERIAALTPTKLDDKLLSYMKLAFEAYKTKFSKKPEVADVKELIAHAEKKAAESKGKGSN